MNWGGQSEDKRSVKHCGMQALGGGCKDCPHCLFIGLALDGQGGKSLK